MTAPITFARTYTLPAFGSFVVVSARGGLATFEVYRGGAFSIAFTEGDCSPVAFAGDR